MCRERVRTRLSSAKEEKKPSLNSGGGAHRGSEKTSDPGKASAKPLYDGDDLGRTLRDSKATRLGLATLVHDLGVICTTAYILWVLAGTVAWVSHLGARIPALGRLLPGHGAPVNAPASGIFTFFGANVPLACCFVLPHSILLPHRLRKLVGQRYTRLAYCLHSGLSLHLLLSWFTPLATPIVFDMPCPTALHDVLSLFCLIYATACYAREPATFHLLGTVDALGWDCIKGLRKAPAKMDAITWMGMTVWEHGGNLAFVLFTGLSILPASLTLGDALTRGCAAVYLRVRSKGFREWVSRVEGAHLLTWVLRGILVAGWMRSSKGAGWESMAGGLALAGLLRFVESDVVARKINGAMRRARAIF